MIWNSLKLTEDNNPHAADARQNFRQFVINLIKHLRGSTLRGQISQMYQNDTLVPGTFFLPPGYRGIDEGLKTLPFDVFFCDLALKIKEEMENDPNLMETLIELWTDATISMEKFDMDSLLDHFGVTIAPENFNAVSFFMTGKCEVDYDVIVDFLAKVYSLDLNNVVFQNFGTTMEQLVDEGKLGIISKAAAPQWGPDKFGVETWVSVQYA